MTESESPIDIERIEEIREQFAEADSQELKIALEVKLLETILWSDLEPSDLSRYIDSLSEDERQHLYERTNDEKIKMILRVEQFKQTDVWNS